MRTSAASEHRLDRLVRWRCAANCGREVCDEFYQRILREARHPPVCVCRYSPSGWMNPPWSLWEKVDATPNPVVSRR